MEFFFRDLNLTAAGRKQATKQRAQVTEERWIAPPRGFAKVNVDAAVRDQGNMGVIAAVCRNDNGQYLGASSVVVRV